MFAGAAREAVFSNSDVIARIEREFIPVALKAGMVRNPPSGVEGQLYQELKRTQPVTQGICTMNSSGKVLAWSVMFDGNESVLGFLDHVADRFEETPDAAKPVMAERFMRFPVHKLDDMPNREGELEFPLEHECLGDLPRPKGSILTKVVGRALDANGLPLSNARVQENYIEDRFSVPLSFQQTLGDAAKATGGDAFRIPNAFARLLVQNAYLGMLDVMPIGDALIRAKTTKADIVLWARRTGETQLQIWGTSDVSAHQDERGNRGDSRIWEHDITLEWQGAIEFNDDDHSAISKLTFIAVGSERLSWNRGSDQEDGLQNVADLPAGRRIDFQGKVRYGMMSETGEAYELN